MAHLFAGERRVDTALNGKVGGGDTESVGLEALQKRFAKASSAKFDKPKNKKGENRG